MSPLRAALTADREGGLCVSWPQSGDHKPDACAVSVIITVTPEAHGEIDCISCRNPQENSAERERLPVAIDWPAQKRAARVVQDMNISGRWTIGLQALEDSLNYDRPRRWGGPTYDAVLTIWSRM